MDDSKMLIIGAKGQLGTALVAKYPNAVAVDTEELDITDNAKVSSFDFSPFKVVINAAAYTNVDGAESVEGRVIAWQVNAAAVGLLTKALAGSDTTFIHISTDYVFDGTKDNHKEDEPFSPLGVYGQTKAAGDIAALTLDKVYILRTSWVIGEGKNFVRTMLELAQKGVNPKVVSDVLGRPTFTSELVRVIDYLITSEPAFGVYNVTNGGEPTSWAGLARAVFESAGLPNNVTDVKDSEYYADKPEASPRPMNSVLDLSKLESIGYKPLDWKVDLADYIKKG